MAFDHLSAATRKQKRTIYYSAIASLALSTKLAGVETNVSIFGWVTMGGPEVTLSYLILAVLIWSAIEYGANARVDYMNTEGTSMARQYVAAWEEFAVYWNEPETHNLVTSGGTARNDLVFYNFDQLNIDDASTRAARIQSLKESQFFLKSKIPTNLKLDHSRIEGAANFKFWMFDVFAPYIIFIAALANFFIEIPLGK